MNEQDAGGERLRAHFLGWQCRIRQIAMRKDAGRPSAAMRPRVLLPGGAELLPAMVTVLVPEDPHESTDFFRHQVRRTNDPRQIYEKVLEFLQATHFQDSKRFSDALTALFPRGSVAAARLVGQGECILEFDQFSQFYRMICTVAELGPDDPAREATLWHNRAFRPEIPDDVHVLAFTPDWRSVQADPAP
jgi:hypothetical protein